MTTRILYASCLLAGVAACSACSSGADFPFDAEDPGRGPGQLLGKRPQLNESFEGGFSGDPEARAVTPPEGDALPPCDEACRDYCDGLALENPVDAGACRALWGIGLDTRPVHRIEACRRLYTDLLGELPTRGELTRDCPGDSWDEVASAFIADPRFVLLGQRAWADTLLYNNEALSFERIYDADDLVGKLYEGRVAYDEFAAVISAHPVLTRRYDTASDRAEKLFQLFLGRPPYENERSDMARLYVLWTNGYFDHPGLGIRLPDAVIGYRCVDAQGRVDEAAKGECTSVLWGYNELILEPDYRANEDGETWSGLLTAKEWQALQAPGRIIAGEFGFWEHAVDRVLQQYLGYDLGVRIPEVRQALVEYLLAHDGDIRAVHYAVVTSQLYLQTAGGKTVGEHRHTFGPLRQIEVEPWIDSVKKMTGYELSVCDHRLPVIRPFMDEISPAAYELLDASRWELDDDGVRTDYRDLARTLGGCPDNGVGGRFKTVSILTTATQEGFVAEVCNPGLQPDRGADITRLLPGGMDASRAIDPDVAEQIVQYQTQRFFARGASDEEVARARDNADRCAPKPCTAEAFARPVCYALLSSSEMLFY